MLKEYSIGIVDSGLIREKFAGTWIVKSGEEAALVEVSTSHCINSVLDKLKSLEISADSVKYIFITHIHLDHAGGAGNLMQYLPNAKLVVQPSGAKHMIDPSKLIAGANAVYGEEVVKNDYGEIIPIPKDRVIECKDGEEFSIGSRTLKTIYTPGHARHHISIFDSESKGIFTGDSFGLSYPEMDTDHGRFYQPTTTPTAFEYNKMVESIYKMLDLNPKRVYFTHYGYTEDIKGLKTQILKRLEDYKKMAESTINSSDRVKELEGKLAKYYIKEAKNHGVLLKEPEINKLFDIDIKLNAMGLALWFERLNGL